MQLRANIKRWKTSRTSQGLMVPRMVKLKTDLKRWTIVIMRLGVRPRDEDGLEHGEDDVIVDPVMDGIEVDNGSGPQTKDGHSLGVCGNSEGWCIRMPLSHQS